MQCSNPAHNQPYFRAGSNGIYSMCTQNWLHFLHFLENSQRHHYAADASVYLVNIKRQIYYAHRPPKKCSIFYNWS
jgi:hypothetical protein